MTRTLTELKNAKKALTEKAAIYVPSTNDINKFVDSSIYIKTVARAMSAMFGGATVTKAAGYWLSAAAGLVAEDVTIIYSYTTAESLQAHEQDIVKIADWLRTEMNQEAVSIEINNELFLVD